MMKRMSLLSAAALMFGFAGAGAAMPQQSEPTTPKTPQTSSAQTSKGMSREATLSGCLRQTSDDPKVFALVDAKPKTENEQPTGTSGTAIRAPFFRLEDPGTPALKPQVGKRVEVTGTITRAKDEKGADIVSTTRETIGVDTVTIRTLDLKPAPTFDVKSIKAVGDCPTPKSK